MVLFTALRLGVFDALSGAPRPLSDLAQAAGARERPFEMLLNACVAQELLRREPDGRYRNTPLAEAYLTSSSRAYIGDGLRYSEDLYEPWGRLDDLMRSGRALVESESYLGGDVERTRHFVRAMHNRALGIAAALPSGIDLRGRKRLLDVGGGPGTYSILLTQSSPGLTAVVMDLAAVLEICREIVSEFGADDRVTTLAASYLDSDFPAGFDVVLFSGMMHRETEATCRALLSKAARCLDRGGIVVVSDVFFENAAKDRPPFATHFALNMMLTSANGSAHSLPEMSEWLRSAGFADIETRHLPPPNPHSVVVGVKP